MNEVRLSVIPLPVIFIKRNIIPRDISSILPKADVGPLSPACIYKGIFQDKL